MRSKNTGSIYQRRDGRWVFSWTEPDGSRPSRYFRSEAAALDFELEVRRRLKARKPGADSVQTFKQLADRWKIKALPTARARDGKPLSPGTVKDYLDVLRLHVIPAIGDVPLRELDDDAIESIFARMQSHTGAKGLPKPLSPSYMRQAVKVTTKILDYGKKQRLISENPLRDPEFVKPSSKVTVREVVVPDRDQARALIAAAPSGRLTVFTTIALYAGLRIGEITNLQWRRDIDWRRGQLRIDVSKGGKKGLTVPMVPPLTRALKQWRTELAAERLAATYWLPDHDPDEPDWVLPSMVGTKWETHNLRKQFNRFARPVVPGVTPHGLRHTTATLLAEEGAPPAAIAEVMRHANISIAQDTYIEVTKRLKGSAMDGLVVALGES